MSGIEDRLSPSSNTAEFAESCGFVLTARMDQGGAKFVGDERLEIFAGKAFVAENHLAFVEDAAVVA